MKLPKPYNETKIKKKLRKEADDLWKLACLKKYGDRCELCGRAFGITAHHFYYKGSVGHLRYEINNGVILCAPCHCKLHFQDPKLVESLIIDKRGRRWYNKLKKKAEEKHYSYQTIGWYREHIKNLQNGK